MKSIGTVAFSGVRPGESKSVVTIIETCGLETRDISTAMLKNFLVARKEGAIIGTVGLEICGPDALLRSLAVLEGCRRAGIGRKLVDAVESYALSRNIQRLYLLTLTAPAFFQHAGYVEIDRQTAPGTLQATGEFSRLCPDTAVCMYKEIANKS